MAYAWIIKAFHAEKEAQHIRSMLKNEFATLTDKNKNK